MEGFITLTKITALVVFFLFYCGVLFWAYRGKNKKRLEDYREIPFLED